MIVKFCGPSLPALSAAAALIRRTISLSQFVKYNVAAVAELLMVSATGVSTQVKTEARQIGSQLWLLLPFFSFLHFRSIFFIL